MSLAPPDESPLPPRAPPPPSPSPRKADDKILTAGKEERFRSKKRSARESSREHKRWLTKEGGRAAVEKTRSTMGTGSLESMKADYLKRKADGEVKKENYRDAVKHYTEALQVSTRATLSLSVAEAW